MKNKLPDLRDHLFEAIEMLKSGDMELDKAQAINSLAQTLVASAKVEVDYVKHTGGMNDRIEFIEGNPAPQPMRLVKQG
jgi:hypothetical protein